MEIDIDTKEIDRLRNIMEKTEDIEKLRKYALSLLDVLTFSHKVMEISSIQSEKTKELFERIHNLMKEARKR